MRWTVTLANEGGGETIEEQDTAKTRALEADAMDHPLMQAVIAAFPAAKITDIRSRESMAIEAAVTALPEVDDEWDPFEAE